MRERVISEHLQRKHIRLQNFDYSANGAYFITICTEKRRRILSRVVGRGLAPAETSVIECTKWGKIAERQLLLLEERYPYLKIDPYVIMPDHIHAIFILDGEAAGASPRPTIIDIVCAYKSLTTIACRKNGFSGTLFQASFFDHVIRNQPDYADIYQYIYDNPIRWRTDKLYAEKTTEERGSLENRMFGKSVIEDEME